MYIYSMSEGQVFLFFANAMAFINNLIFRYLCQEQVMSVQEDAEARKLKKLAVQEEPSVKRKVGVQ